MKKFLFLFALLYSIGVSSQSVRTTSTDYYSITGQFTNSSPADGQTLYFTDMGLSANTATANRLMVSAFSGVITDAVISWNSSVASSESATVSILSNGTTYPVKTNIDMSTNIASVLVTGLSIPITSNTPLIPVFITPTWVTNPTGVFLTVKFYARKN